jgi:DnaJ-class molecular chaperone
MKGLGYNYPAGAALDPRAPWNQDDAENCARCDGRGYVGDEDNNSDCACCWGTGLEKTLAALHDEWKEEKADESRKERE